jgi:putative transposase
MPDSGLLPNDQSRASGSSAGAFRFAGRAVPAGTRALFPVLNTRRHRTGHLWQQRYFSCPLSESHHWVALRYVEQNPCRAFMVNKPEDYRWSSAAAHLEEGKDRSGVLDLEFWRKAGGAATWREMHTAREAPEQLQLLRRCTYSGRPYGEEDFVARLEEQFQRSWRRWGFERLAASA